MFMKNKNNSSRRTRHRQAYKNIVLRDRPVVKNGWQYYVYQADVYGLQIYITYVRVTGTEV